MTMKTTWDDTPAGPTSVGAGSGVGIGGGQRIGAHGWRHRALVLVGAWLLTVAFGGVVRAADGALDETFGGDGKVVTGFPIGAFANDVAVQPDGKIIAAGAAAGRSATGVFALARYGSHGSLDRTFGRNGRVTTAVSDGGDEVHAIAIQPDGRIVAVGSNQQQFELARYTTDGGLDPTFGFNGIMSTDLTSDYDIVYDMAIQPNGKILVGGLATPGSPWRPRFALARYLSNGTLDPTFGQRGTLISRLGIVRAIVLQPDGKILAVGYGSSGFALARYTRDGTPDRTFGGDGKVNTTFNGGAFTAALQPNGRIVIAGAYDFYRFAVGRYLADGRLDKTFGDDGVVITDVGGSEQGVADLVVQHNGRIVAVGHAGPHEASDPVRWRFVLTRYRANGVLDGAFGRDGRVETKFVGGGYASAAAAAPAGRIIVAGGMGEASAEAFALARYLI